MTTMKASIAGLAALAVAASGIIGLSTHSAHAAQSEAPVPGGGAPAKVLLDNNALRVTLISYPAGFHRNGPRRRPYDTLLVYITPAEYIISHPARAGGAVRPRPAAGNSRLGTPAHCGPVKDCGPIGPDGTYQGHPLPPGTITYHPEGNMAPALDVPHGYQVLYIEVKK